MCQPLEHQERCLIPPSPELRERMKDELERLQEVLSLSGPEIHMGEAKRPGLNDGLIIPGDQFPLGTPLEVVRSAAAERAPLRGLVRVIVVLVDFADRQMSPQHDAAHFRDLFFSRGKLQHGSVREYFAQVSHGLVDIGGEVVGPYRLPLRLEQYANGESGTGAATPNARTMARAAAEAANGAVNFRPYDNDGNGYVDAFIVIHAGPGGEQTGSGGDIWSHKWVLPNGAYNADGTRIYAYLTIPEDARIGVACHELGHLLFGWPDLYDTDGSSEGLGTWCLMAGGSWNGDGDIPAHPSAWCKARQGWISVVNQTRNATLSIPDVKDGHVAYRLWKDGAQGKEYFLVENRRRRQFDSRLPGDGLLVYHVDETTDSNADERRPLVALLQADGREDLNRALNRGDSGDPFPGSTRKRELSTTTSPSTKSNAGVATGVAIQEIAQSGTAITARVAVRAAAARPPRRGLPWFRIPETAGALPGQFASRRDALITELLELYSTNGDDGASDESTAPDEEWVQVVEQRLEAIEAALDLRSSGLAAPGFEEAEDPSQV